MTRRRKGRSGQDGIRGGNTIKIQRISRKVHFCREDNSLTQQRKTYPKRSIEEGWRKGKKFWENISWIGKEADPISELS